MTDVVTPYDSQLSDTAKLGSTFYNKVTRKRSYYLCPIKQGAPRSTSGETWSRRPARRFPIYRIPGTRDGTSSSRCRRNCAARECGTIYALGLQVTTVGPNDGNNLFQHFLIANGGKGIVTPDGKLHTDDPQVREAAIKSTTFLADAYKAGVVPPEALSWNDADDNNGFHEKLFIADFDGTLSTELAMIDNKEDFYHDS